MKTILLTVLFVLILSGCADTNNVNDQYIEATYKYGYAMGAKDGVEAGKNAALYGINTDIRILMNESWENNKQTILGK